MATSTEKLPHNNCSLDLKGSYQRHKRSERKRQIEREKEREREREKRKSLREVERALLSACNNPVASPDVPDSLGENRRGRERYWLFRKSVRAAFFPPPSRMSLSSTQRRENLTGNLAESEESQKGDEKKG